VPRNLVINNGSTVRLARDQQTSLSADVLVNGGGLFAFSTFFTLMNTLRGVVTVKFGVGGWIYIGSNNRIIEIVQSSLYASWKGRHPNKEKGPREHRKY
jgi:hypothetical protein